jgi:alpha-L-fucosidase 2
LWARFHDGGKFYENMFMLLKISTMENLFDYHPPFIFQIDGNLGGIAAINEAVMQCKPGKEADDPCEIILLPALPAAWPNGSLKGIKARGNISADISWKDGRLTEAVFTAMDKGKAHVRYRDKTQTLDLKSLERKEARELYLAI